MKKVIRLIVVAIISCIVFQGKAQVISDRARDGLKGKVSSCTTKVYKAADKFGEIQEGSLLSDETVIYDKHGFKLSDKEHRYENKYAQTDKISIIDVYKGSILYRKHIFEHKSGKAIETVYDESGDKIESIIWTPNKSVISDYCTETTTYNGSGQTIKKVQRCDGRTIRIYTYSYNSRSAPIKFKSSYPDFYNQDETITYSQYKYDSKGNWTYRVNSRNGSVVSIVKREIEY